MDWFNLAQDRNQWRVLVNTVMNLQFHLPFLVCFSGFPQFYFSDCCFLA
jgi:hypothetical protein